MSSALQAGRFVRILVRRPPSSSVTSSDAFDHYNGHFRLGLTAAETKDLIEHLKAL
jgi:hypothetical protein